MSNPKEKHVESFLAICGKVGPEQFGFARLIDVGEQLRSSFSSDKQIYASLIGSIAALYHALMRFESAEEHYKEVLEIYRNLAKRNPDAFNSYLAGTLNNLGNLHGDLRNFELAELDYKEALEIYRTLAKRSPDIFNSYLAGTLNNLAALYGNLMNLELAEQHYKEALEIYRELTKRYPEAFNSHLGHDPEQPGRFVQNPE